MCEATLAQATGRYTEATRLAREAFKLFSDMGHPTAFGACAVIMTQAGLHIGMDAAGLVELFGQIPAHLRPDAVDTTRGVATVFPALTLALIRLHQGDRAGAEAAYALAGPVQSWNPRPAMRLSCWAAGLAVAIPLGRADDIELLAARFGPFRGQHVANGAGRGVYMGPGGAPARTGRAALGHLDAAVADLETAASVCDTNGAHGYAVQARVELAEALGRRQAPGDLGRARAALDAAADAAEQLGMVPFSRADTTAARPAVGRRDRGVTVEPARAGGRPAGRAGADQQADRPGPVRLGADGREPRAAHPDQARAAQPQPDRRLGQRRAGPGLSTPAGRE